MKKLSVSLLLTFFGVVFVFAQTGAENFIEKAAQLHNEGKLNSGKP